MDSSIGGKTALNLPQGKNLVGTFYQPNMVLPDPALLSTLSNRDLHSGLGEILKYGFIRDWSIVEKVANNYSHLITRTNLSLVVDIIFRCCQIKAKIVEQDEQDRGLRQILNFGHTIGHSLEAGCGYDHFQHGEAVIWGMIGEAWISEHRGYISFSELDSIKQIACELDIPRIPSQVGADQLQRFIKRDKKVRRDQIRCVLLTEVGKSCAVETISYEELTGAVTFLQRLSCN